MENKILINYIANIRMPTQRAHGLQIMKTCEALSKNANVRLIVPTRRNNTQENPFDFYNVKKSFEIKYIGNPDLIEYGRIGYTIQTVLFSISSVFYCLFYKTAFDRKFSVIYSRDELPVFLSSFFSKNIFWEVHDIRNNLFTKNIVKKVKGIVTITKSLKEVFIKIGVKDNKILVSSDAVDPKTFIVNKSKEECRKTLGLENYKKIIIYTGHLYSWKGVDTLGYAVKYLDNDTHVLFVGGSEKHQQDFRNRHKSENIHLLPQVKHEVIPLYLKSADVLVLPNTAKEDISRLYTSPMKLFEYMASGVPIVASNISSINEVLNDKTAVFFEPDNEESLASSIKEVINNPEKYKAIAENAREVVNKKYTWKNRGESIITFIRGFFI